MLERIDRTIVGNVIIKAPFSGIYTDISIDEYHSLDGISNSGINVLRQSPKKYWYHYLSNARKKEDGKDKIIGSALHTLVLEPHTFFDRFSIYPEGIDRRTKAGKVAYANYQLLMEGKQELKIEEFDLVQAMGNAMKTHPMYDSIFCNEKDKGHIENTLIWEDNGVILRSRPDFYNSNLVVDIKTTRTTSQKDFKRSISDYGYHRQAYIALNGLTKLTGRDYSIFILFVVEKEPPHLTAMYVLDDKSINIGRIEVDNALAVYRECSTNNFWPGYSCVVENISVPDWYKLETSRDETMGIEF